MVYVTVLGAAGGIGQPLSLLLKTNTHISQLNLYDIRNVRGVATDLSHINTHCSVEAFEGPDELGKALINAQLVIIPAGVPRRPGMTRDDLFSINAGIVRTLVTAVAKHCPSARLLIISNPVNSTVPIAVETFKRLGKLNPARIFGVTTLDVVRAQTFLLEILGRRSYPIEKIARGVTVVGGHSGPTIVPLLTNKLYATQVEGRDMINDYVRRVQYGGDEVVRAKDGAGSATLSMAVAGYHFADLILRSVHGQKLPAEPAYVYLPGIPGGAKAQAAITASTNEKAPEYFALPIVLENGEIVDVDVSALNAASNAERALLRTALSELAKNIRKGEEFAGSKPRKGAKL